MPKFIVMPICEYFRRTSRSILCEIKNQVEYNTIIMHLLSKII